MLNALPRPGLIDLLDILLVAAIIYWILLFIRGTRAVQILLGLLLLFGTYLASRQAGLLTFQWVVGSILGSLIVIIAVVFQSEIRRGLALVGRSRVFGLGPTAPEAAFLDDLVRAVFRLAGSRVGAMVLFERGVGLSEYVEHARKLDALFSWELLASILATASPLHDGAVVLRGERIAAAGVILPIPADTSATRSMGTRHRAAWGIAAETDTVAIVVSEETGKVTVFHGREARVARDAETLREILGQLLGEGRERVGAAA